MQPLTPQQPVVFVGAFLKSAHNGGVGGQAYACRTLIDSAISERVRWICIDSSLLVVPAPPLHRRVRPAVSRVGAFVQALVAEPQAAALVFAGDGPSFLEKGTMVLMARALGRRAVLCPRSGLLLDNLERSAFFRRFVPLVLGRASAVVCQSSQWAETFGRISPVGKQNLHVIPNWIRAGDYAAQAASRRDEGPIRTFLYMGWVEEFKGIFDLIAAAAERRADLAAARFVVCGAGTRLQEAKDLVQSLGIGDNFDFRGWVHGEAKEAAMREADVLVLPSRREGMPNVVLEAMAAGLPVVATAVGGVPDLITSEVSGLLVDVGKPAALGAALVRCLREPGAVRGWGLQALAVVRARHDVEVAWPALLRAIVPAGPDSADAGAARP